MANSRNSSLSADLVAAVAARLRQFVHSGDRLVVALSGGLDSIALLHLLRRTEALRDCALAALHVNHHISANADRWQAFCQETCEAWRVPLLVHHLEPLSDSGDGLEGAARRARYAVFARTEANWLVLAHHRDDQTETLMLNLLRGAGIAGAAGMPAMRVFRECPALGLLRPLLDFPREALSAYACAEGLGWIEDESNQDLRHSRNFIRHRILPALRERFPGCDRTLARAAMHFAEGRALLDQIACVDAELVVRNGRMIVAELSNLDDARLRNLLRHVLGSEGVLMPDSSRLHEIVRQIRHADANRHVRFDLGTRTLHRYRGELWLVVPGEVVAELPWRGEAALQWGGNTLRFERRAGAGISQKLLADHPVTIAPRKGGERIRPDRLRPRRTLRKLLQEHAIPPWEREVLPLLWCENTLVWAAGIGVDCAWQCAPGEAGLLPDWSGSSGSQIKLAG